MTTPAPLSPAPLSSVSDLSREVDHRIANSLAMISGLVRVRARGNTADPKPFLLEIADRIDTVGMLHRHLAEAGPEGVQLSGYLRGIFERSAAAMATDPPTCSVSCPSEPIISSKIAMPLGIIAAELFSNSLKYAHPTGVHLTVRVLCTRVGPDRLTLVYEDDGVGFPEGFDPATGGYLGMRFIRLLTDQLGGICEWSSDPLGVRFETTITL